MTGSAWPRLCVIYLVALLFTGASSLSDACSVLARQTTSTARPPAFSRLYLSGGASLNARQTGAAAWNPRGGARIQAATPLGRGRLGAGVIGLAFRSDQEGLPDWTAFFVHAGWRATWHAHTRLVLGAGLRAGNVLMLFDDADLVAGQRRESEFAIEPHVRADIQLTRRGALFLEGGLLRTFTAPRIDLGQVSAGLVIDVTMPAWLRRVIE